MKYASLFSTDKIVVVTPFEDRDRCQLVGDGRWDARQRGWVYPLTLQHLTQIARILPELEWDDALGAALTTLQQQEQRLLDIKAGNELLEFNGALKTTLRDYQRIGASWLVAAQQAMLADELGAGKSLQCLAASTWLKTQKKITKCLIVCPNTVKRSVWQRQIELHTHETAVLIHGTKAQRMAALERWTVNDALFCIINIEAVRDTLYLPSLQNAQMLILDECMDYFQSVVLANGKRELIGKIVCKKMPVSVLSFNHATQQVEPQRVINWFRHSLHRPMLKISISGWLQVRCTPQHKIWTKNGWQLAATLRVGDEIAINYPDLTLAQKSMALGCIMGDGYLGRPKNAKEFLRVTLIQHQRDKAYLNWKLRFLGGQATHRTIVSGYTNKKTICVGTSKSHPWYTRLRDQIEQCGKEALLLLPEANAQTLAIWYMDDGSISLSGNKFIPYCTLHTEGMEQQPIIQWLKQRFNLRAKIVKYRTFECLSFNGGESKKLLTLIAPFCHPQMQRKLASFTSGRPSQHWTSRTPSALSFGKVRKIAPWHPYREKLCKMYAYDIEVEKNHNYFAGNILVSNSIKIKNPKSAQTKSLKRLQPEYRIAVSGYPVANKPDDLWSQFDWVRPGYLGSWWSFQDQYCVTQQRQMGATKFKEIVGYKGLDQLKSRIDPYVLRRLKSDVLSLPPKIYEMREVDLTAEQRALYESIRHETLTWIQTLDDGALRLQAREVIVKMLRLSQIVNGFLSDISWEKPRFFDSPKRHELDAIVDEVLSSNRSIVIWSRFRMLLAHLVTHYQSKYGTTTVIELSGAVDERQRAVNVAAFQAGTAKICLGQVQTGGIGIDLTAASTEVFIEKALISIADIEQASDRLHRIGQTQSVTIINLVARNTIDEHWEKLLQQKRHMASQLLSMDTVGTLTKADYQTLLE